MDWMAWSAQLVMAVVPVLTMLVVWGIRKLIPLIPRVVLPFLAMGLPFVLTLLMNYIGGHEFNPVVGALLGAAATWLREVITTIQEHGTKS